MKNYKPSTFSTSAIEGSIAAFEHTIAAAKHDRKLQSQIPDLEAKIKIAKEELEKRNTTS